MDSFIFLVDLAYISPPPEADTKTNGLSSRSYKTSPPPDHPRPSSPSLATAFRRYRRRRRPARLANVKHRRGELTFSTSCQT